MPGSVAWLSSDCPLAKETPRPRDAAGPRWGHRGSGEGRGDPRRDPVALVRLPSSDSSFGPSLLGQSSRENRAPAFWRLRQDGSFSVATAYLTRDFQVNPDHERFIERAAAIALLVSVD